LLLMIIMHHITCFERYLSLQVSNQVIEVQGTLKSDVIQSVQVTP